MAPKKPARKQQVVVSDATGAQQAAPAAPNGRPQQQQAPRQTNSAVGRKFAGRRRNYCLLTGGVITCNVVGCRYQPFVRDGQQNPAFCGRAFINRSQAAAHLIADHNQSGAVAYAEDFPALPEGYRYPPEEDTLKVLLHSLIATAAGKDKESAAKANHILANFNACRKCYDDSMKEDRVQVKLRLLLHHNATEQHMVSGRGSVLNGRQTCRDHTELISLLDATGEYAMSKFSPDIDIWDNPIVSKPSNKRPQSGDVSEDEDGDEEASGEAESDAVQAGARHPSGSLLGLLAASAAAEAQGGGFFMPAQLRSNGLPPLPPQHAGAALGASGFGQGSQVHPMAPGPYATATYGQGMSGGNGSTQGTAATPLPLTMGASGFGQGSQVHPMAPGPYAAAAYGQGMTGGNGSTQGTAATPLPLTMGASGFGQGSQVHPMAPGPYAAAAYGQGMTGGNGSTQGTAATPLPLNRGASGFGQGPQVHPIAPGPHAAATSGQGMSGDAPAGSSSSNVFYEKAKAGLSQCCNPQWKGAADLLKRSRALFSTGQSYDKDLYGDADITEACTEVLELLSKKPDLERKLAENSQRTAYATRARNYEEVAMKQESTRENVVKPLLHAAQMVVAQLQQSHQDLTDAATSRHEAAHQLLQKISFEAHSLVQYDYQLSAVLMDIVQYVKAKLVEANATNDSLSNLESSLRTHHEAFPKPVTDPGPLMTVADCKNLEEDSVLSSCAYQLNVLKQTAEAVHVPAEAQTGLTPIKEHGLPAGEGGCAVLDHTNILSKVLETQMDE
ncbi:hypothetical protein Agub_g6471 [Astrephomene gubernaculifera]|uniref:Uncharacterized protein n=1 Tax=Astrephomene gubernaculifera TaxID=47775 RepID=A0AAD3HLU6_9CHLO|nr:hypothetical protein Agub_g6471 [Astrephomene gubernaculifera]